MKMGKQSSKNEKCTIKMSFHIKMDKYKYPVFIRIYIKRMKTYEKQN